MAIPGPVLLAGVVGSTAYGLATEDSDVDRLGMFAAPTEAFHGLHRPAETSTTTHPDATFHEAGKWLRLALGGNPTVMELAWLDQYETITPLGGGTDRHALLAAVGEAGSRCLLRVRDPAV